jgi:hypothetical protein
MSAWDTQSTIPTPYRCQNFLMLTAGANGPAVDIVAFASSQTGMTEQGSDHLNVIRIVKGEGRRSRMSEPIGVYRRIER